MRFLDYKNEWLDCAFCHSLVCHFFDFYIRGSAALLMYIFKSTDDVLIFFFCSDTG